MQCDLAIVGAGAAGLSAGIFAKQANPDASVVLLDGARKVGAKILVAGGGRCNVTHHAVDVRDYNAASRNFVKNVLASFTVEDTTRWLDDMGVQLKREPTGKLFPTTDKARTVLDALLGRLADLGVDLRTESRVTGIVPTGDGFTLFINETEKLTARRLIVCTGGRSLPKTGSDGGGYALAKALGHTVTDTHPALVSIVLQQHFFHANLAGISHDAEIVTTLDRKPIDRRTSSLLWTHFGLSGPVVMDASRHFLAAKLAGGEPQWTLNLLPGERFDTVEPKLLGQSSVTLRRAIDGLSPMPEKVVDAMLASIGVAPDTPLAQLKKDQRRKVVHTLTALPLPVEQDRGWNHAEVTAGGVPLSEVAWKTMSSRKHDGVHLAGEILDLDGRIGGFNFQWAWATGHLAGKAAAQALASDLSNSTSA
ncbi:MAG: aminoacetone oxidase family FAD-binding enzyme [Planctomycetota bacterium]